MGAEAAQGLLLAEPFYWDFDDRTRALTSRVLPKMPPNICPSTNHAGAYSAVLHYIRTAAAMGGATAAKASGRATIARMKALPTEDDCFGPRPGARRWAEDSSRPFVRGKAASRGEDWLGLYKLIGSIEAEKAMRPLAEGGCPLVQG